jgi:hypothetical protein
VKRTSLFLPEELIARLRAESDRSGVTVAELVRRACDAVVPPADVRLGDLKPLVDKVGFLEVLVLNAREGKLQVEPNDPTKLEGVAFWVPSHLVSFGDKGERKLILDPRALAFFEKGALTESGAASLRMNKDRVEPDPAERKKEAKVPK